MKTRSTYANSMSSMSVAVFGLAGIVLMPVLQALAATSPVELGSAKSCRVLAASLISSIGETIVYGDLGLSPGTTFSGFPPGIVTGATRINDGIAAQAQDDLALAYDDAASRFRNANLIAAEIGGLTLTQGLYRAATTLAITTGNLILDAQGDEYAYWIIQVGTTLGVAASKGVILTNGARSANVVWQVGTSATLGANSTFCGTILAHDSITLGAGGTFEGRALAVNAAVQLDANIFLVEGAIVLAASTDVAGPYVAEPNANVNLQAQTITASTTNSTCFYVLKSSTALTITGIRIAGESVVINYDYQP